ncbi:hypothetical protein PCANC_11556 [Puccinia coronata f. sp. avenae]|uniref:Uncharacterized protein n=1 Tax=Puccinia coronata f. sp. avenae TaxID=200324 RepID=A0A2N5UQH1_9BASI|nr:hypothetical protein PCANC_11556 [Puccinia coronata f. sp. avenae]
MLSPSNPKWHARPHSVLPKSNFHCQHSKKSTQRKNNKRKRGKGQQDETNPTPNSVGAATTEGPLSIVTQKASKKQKKSLQTEQERCPTPVEELVKLSVIELRKISQDYSKQSMSDEDEEFFLALHQEQEKQQAIKAIERGVSLSMVFAILGRRIAVKEANRWNRFLQTDQARLIFAESGLGVKDKTVMKQLSEAYSLLSEEEKAALETNPNLNDSPAEEDSSSPVNCEDDTDPSINPNLLRGTVSAKDRYEKAQKAMNTWLEQQKRAIKSNNAINVVDGDNRFAARLQSFISGQLFGQIAVAQKLGKTHTNLKVLRSQLTHAMAKFTQTATQGILTEWPWTETDHNLWAAGYKLQLSTKPAFCVEWLKSPTRDRKIVEVRLFLRELRLEKIRLIPRGAHKIEPTWDLNNPNVCPTCHQKKPAAGSLSPATHTQGNTASGGTNTFEAEDLGGNPTASTTNTS